MATSGSYSFTVNRDEIILDAMQNIGKLGDGEIPTASEVSSCARKLNMLIKQWQGRPDFSSGLKVWTRRRGYLFLNSSSGQYTIGPAGVGWTNGFSQALLTSVAAAGQPAISVDSAAGIVAGYHIGVVLSDSSVQWTTVSTVVGTAVTLATNLTAMAGIGSTVYCYQTTGQQPLNIETAVLRDNAGNDVPLKIMRSVQDYDYLPSKASPTNVSDPMAIYYESQLGNGVLYTDVAGAIDPTKYIVLTYLESVQDVLNPDDEFEYPQEWFLALSWGLSKEIAPMFQARWTGVMEDNYKVALAIAQHKDSEINTSFFQPGAEE